MEKSLNLGQLAGLADIATQYSSLAEDYVFTRVTADERLKLAASGPIRINGMACILCLEGQVDLDINLQEGTLSRQMLMVVLSDNIVSVRDVSPALDCYMLVVSPAFMRTMSIDTNVLNSLPPVAPRSEQPLMQLTGEEVALLRRYFDLIHLNTSSNPDGLYVRSITRSLIAGMFYQTIQFAAKRMKDAGYDMGDGQRPRSRRMGYVSDFMRLVRQHHMRERSVSFYAGKLFITTKYLSMLVKDATGRSAAEWIDEYVILEAKNLLRFSDKTIKQVSNELNFANQSSFGKYFKLLTGMSPTEYQRS